MDLLQRWDNIYHEAVELAEEIERLPDQCECGDGEAHLERRCRCCGGHQHTPPAPASGETCTEILARLRADLAMLWEDFALVLGPIKAVALEAQRLELRRGVFLTANDLQQIAESLERVTQAVVGFRRTCAVSEMHSLKRQCKGLREHCERVNAELLGGQSEQTGTGRSG